MAKYERVKDDSRPTKEELKIYNDKIDESIQDFIIERNIDDLSKESQNIWNACLIYTQRRLFADNSILKMDTGNRNYYDPEKVNVICDLYIYYCLMYDKEINITGFCYLTNISREIINQWSSYIDNILKDNDYCIYNKRLDNSNIKLSTKHLDIYKKLSEGRESSLSAMLTSGRKNPVGIIAILNHFYGWSSPYVSEANKGLQDKRTAAEIAQEYNTIPEQKQNLFPPD